MRYLVSTLLLIWTYSAGAGDLSASAAYKIALEATQNNPDIHFGGYGLNYMSSGKTLKHKGWTDAEIMSLYFGEACWHDACWSGEVGNYGSAAPGHAVTSKRHRESIL